MHLLYTNITAAFCSAKRIAGFKVYRPIAAVAIPVRIAVVAMHRRLALKEPIRDGAREGLSLVPTLVFTLVLARMLQERYRLDGELYGALIVFAIVTTVLPGLVLRVAPPEFAAPRVPAGIVDEAAVVESSMTPPLDDSSAGSVEPALDSQRQKRTGTDG